MRIHRRMAALGVAAALLAAVPAVSSFAASGGVSPNCKHGPTHGGVQLPSAGQPGMLKGVLEDGGGNVLFHVEAKLAPPAAAGQPGKLVGQLLVKTPAGPKPVAKLHGEWKPASATDGGIRAVFLKPGASGPEKAGAMKAKYKLGTTGNGAFVGHWILCK